MDPFTNIMQCPICYTPFNTKTHIPKVLTCGHSICSNSLSMLYKEKCIKCPQCRTVNEYENIEKVATNFSFIEMLRTLSDKNFLMIGAQPIQEEIHKLDHIQEEILAENEEIEYFFDQKIEELKREKEKVLNFNREKIRAL